MSIVKQCDIHGGVIADGHQFHIVKIDDENPFDMCEECFTGNVNLSERRRMRKGRAKPKVGRSRGRRTRFPSGLPADEQLIVQPDKSICLDGQIFIQPQDKPIVLLSGQPDGPFELSAKTRELLRKQRKLEAS